MDTDKEYFEARVTKVEGCWVWEGHTLKSGYGSTSRKRKYSAHRLAYSVYKGPIPEGMQVDHLCSNPPCGNPDHLDVVSPLIDGTRKRIRNAWRGWATHCSRGHELNDRTTGWRPDGSGRQCMVCSHARQNEFRKRNGRKLRPPFDYTKPNGTLKNKKLYDITAADYDLADIDVRFVEVFWQFDRGHSSSKGVTNGSHPPHIGPEGKAVTRL